MQLRSFALRNQIGIAAISESLDAQFIQLTKQIAGETAEDVPATWMEYVRFSLYSLWRKEGVHPLPAERFDSLRAALNAYPDHGEVIDEALACLDQLQEMHRRHAKCIQHVKLILPAVRQLDAVKKTVVELIEMNGILEETRRTLSETRDTFVKQTKEFLLFKENCLKIEKLHAFMEDLVKRQHTFLSRFHELRLGKRVKLGSHCFQLRCEIGEQAIQFKVTNLEDYSSLSESVRRNQLIEGLERDRKAFVRMRAI
ncbi:MAG: hypothetical protein S4CHLAM2_14680 [Chlamydiales bacterium]|nr:hypothetical protein [Chlamydiales bacterium]